jgi:ribosomal protein L13
MVSQMKTYMAKAGEIEQKWWLVDAQDKVVWPVRLP